MTPRSLRFLPSDLVFVFVITAGAAFALLVPGVPQPIEWAFGIPLLLFLPGYALVAALFLTRPTAGREFDGSPSPPGWDVRVAVALVLSVLVVALVGVVLAVVGSFRLLTVVLGIGATTCLGVAIAWVRRRGVATGRRADPLVGISPRIASNHGLSRAQTAVFGISILVLLWSVTVFGAVPSNSSAYSEVSLLSGNDDVELLGTNETATFAVDSDNTVAVKIDNQEGREIDYELVGQIQRIQPNGTVLDSSRIDQGDLTVPAGESIVSERELTPTMTGDRLRLQYLVYKGSAPEEPRVENADLSVHTRIGFVLSETG